MKRILVIEDELEMLRNLTTILRLENFRPVSAENGRAGVDLAKKQKPDLIPCDVMMPGLDGYGVIAALRADAETATIPFIFLTAKAEKLDIRAGMNLGADDHLTKPVAKTDLLAAIHSRLERAVQQAVPEFKPNFHSAVPLKEVLGLTTRVAETLLWLAQGKTNSEIATILGNSESTVKKHVFAIFEKLGLETEQQPACALWKCSVRLRLTDKSLRFFADCAAKKWPLRGSKSNDLRQKKYLWRTEG
jgi:DNA-binding NarL/FixJ family response regulator